MLALAETAALISSDSGIALGMVITLGMLIWAASSTLTDLRNSIKTLQAAADEQRREDERREKDEKEWEKQHLEWQANVIRRLDHVDPPPERSGHWRAPLHPRDPP
jgi:hypothetical protein